jgi:Fic family protein
MIHPYHPPKLPINIDLSKITEELGEAAFELGKLDGLQRNLLNPTLLVSPLTVKEATVSSKIEGTRSTISDVMLFEVSDKAEHSDTIEVANYRKAILYAVAQIKDQKLNISFIKTLHSLLLENVRGHEKRGEFRKEQVFVGAKGTTIEKATYVPPEPYIVQEYMENLESFIADHSQNNLVKAALLHYQFEAVHPFNDGNGRIGRLIIPLYLYSKGLLYQPILYLSGFFDNNRRKYIDTLHIVDETQKYEEWVKFFLKAVAVQASETQGIISKINQLREVVAKDMLCFKSPYTDITINFLFKKPIFKSSDLRMELGIGRSTSARIINKFLEEKIIDRFHSDLSKTDLYIFSGLVSIL